MNCRLQAQRCRVVCFLTTLLGAPLALAAVHTPHMLVVWGAETNVPPQFSVGSAAAGGFEHSVVLFTNGTVGAWGKNGNCQTNVPAGLTNVLAISTRYYHTLALKEDGSVVAWACNFPSSVLNVPGNLTDAIAVAAGNGHSVALRADGTVTAWGENNHNQTIVPAGLSNVVGIAAGAYHSLALKANGTVVAWGNDAYGQGQVPLELTNAVAIGCGWYHSLAIKSDGGVIAWGQNNHGQLNSPATCTNLTDVAGGWDHSVGLRADGTVVAWGGRFPDLTNVPLVVRRASAIAAGTDHAFAAVRLPAIVSMPPRSITPAPGATTNLTFGVVGGGAFSCKWFFNSTEILGATSTNLLIAGFQLSKAGLYDFQVSAGSESDRAEVVLRFPNSPVVHVDGNDIGGGATYKVDFAHLTMNNTGTGAFIYFTLDGSDPDFTDILYSGAFTLTHTTTIRAIAYNTAHTESAEAAPITVVITPSYPLVLSTAGGGSVDAVPSPYSANRYVSNTLVTVTATPSPGWQFTSWTGDSSAATNVIAFPMDGPRTLSAVFGTTPSLFTNGNGSLVLNPPLGPYPFGSTLQATALPDPGHYFFGWAGAITGFSNRA